MKYIYLLFIATTSLITSAERKQVVPYMYIPQINGEIMYMDDYKALVESFRNCNFSLHYCNYHREYTVLFPSNANKAMEILFLDYQTIIFKAYNSMKRSSKTMLPEDPAAFVQAHIKFLESWPINSPYTTKNIKSKQDIWKAFKMAKVNNPRSMMSLDNALMRKNLSYESITSLPHFITNSR